MAYGSNHPVAPVALLMTNFISLHVWMSNFIHILYVWYFKICTLHYSAFVFVCDFKVFLSFCFVLLTKTYTQCLKMALWAFSGVKVVSHQTVAASYPRRTNSLGNTIKWTLFWLAQKFLDTSSGKWASLLYHWLKRCDKRLFSSVFMTTWLMLLLSNAENQGENKISASIVADV